jgi:hypothetical protein
MKQQSVARLALPTQGLGIQGGRLIPSRVVAQIHMLIFLTILSA